MTAGDERAADLGSARKIKPDMECGREHKINGCVAAAPLRLHM